MLTVRSIRLKAAASFLVIPALLWCQVPASETFAPGDLKPFQHQVERMKQLLKTAGDACAVRYALAETYAAAHQWREAEDALEQAVAMKVGLDPGNDEAFDKLRGTREFERLLARVRADTPPSLNARVAFTVDDSRLFPEGIAYSPRHKLFLLGSVFKHSIVACTSAGLCRTMVGDRQDGLGKVLGLRISPLDGTLWAASNSDVASGLFHYSLPAGKLIGKYTIDRKKRPHLFNDLVVGPGGDVFVTDTAAGTVYWLSHATRHLEVFNPALRVESANGIAISDEDQPKLYVAGFPDGITVTDVGSRSFHAIAHPADLCLATIDGLYYYDGDLLAIQNSVMVTRVVRYHLSRDRDAIKSFQILEQRNPIFNVVTTGAIADGVFYFMANTQLHLLADGKIKPGARLNPIKILSIDLSR